MRQDVVGGYWPSQSSTNTRTQRFPPTACHEQSERYTSPLYATLDDRGSADLISDSARAVVPRYAREI